MAKGSQSSESPVVLEQLERRLLLSVDTVYPMALGTLATMSDPQALLLAESPIGPGYPPPLWAGEYGAPPRDPANAVFVPHYDQVPDYDWWYGCSPTAGGMHAAWWDYEVKLPAWMDDPGASAFPGNPQNWLWGAYPSTDAGDFSVPAFANGVVNGWFHIYDGDTREGHMPDSIGDFMMTEQGYSLESGITWGMQTFMAWDDPRTAENESWTATIATIASFAEYTAEIDAGRPVHLWLDSPALGGHSVLGVGYYSTAGGTDYYDLYTTWNMGLEEWDWAGEPSGEPNNDAWVPIGGMSMDLAMPLDGLTGYLAVSHTQVSDLTVTIGLGDPAGSYWQSEVWSQAGGINDNLVMTDIDLSGALTYLTSNPGTDEVWYLEVTDGAGENVGQIMDFQVRYDGARWFTPDVGVAVDDNSTSYAYLNSAIVGQISGTKWEDLDGDAVRDVGESGLPGWTIYLDANSNGQLDAGETSTVTDGNGDYSFTGLPLGTYTVTEVLQAGWVRSLPVEAYITTVSGQAIEGVDFANYRPGQISGVAWNDLDEDGIWEGGEPGLADQLIYIDLNANGQWDAGEQSTLTTADGSYSFTDLAPGQYVVASEIQEGWQRSAPVGGVYGLDIISGSDVQYRDFGSYEPDLPDLGDGGSGSSSFTPSVVSPGMSWSAWWRITNTGAADAGQFAVSFYASIDNDVTTVEDNYLLGNVVIDSLAMGAYEDIILSLSSFPAIPAGDYYVGAVIDSEDSVIESDEGNNTAVDDGYPLRVPGIRGVKWGDVNSDGIQDPSEPVLEGWVIYLDANENGQLDLGETSTTTDADGEYSFTGLTPGTHVVAEQVRPGWTRVRRRANHRIGRFRQHWRRRSA